MLAQLDAVGGTGSEVGAIVKLPPPGAEPPLPLPAPSFVSAHREHQLSDPGSGP